MATVSVIIPAAGSGSRFGSDRNKIFQELNGRAIFLHTLDLFATRRDVCQIQMMLSEVDIGVVLRDYASELESRHVSLVPGGVTRGESVRNAIAGISAMADLVCIHDAVRPCTSRDRIDAVFTAAAKGGSAILAQRVHGTVKLVSDGIINRTMSREGLWQAQTPQVFDCKLFKQAYGGNINGVTDDSQLMEQIGASVSIVPGEATNIKITTPADLAFAEAVLKVQT